MFQPQQASIHESLLRLLADTAEWATVDVLYIKLPVVIGRWRPGKELLCHKSLQCRRTMRSFYQVVKLLFVGVKEKTKNSLKTQGRENWIVMWFKEISSDAHGFSDH